MEWGEDCLNELDVEMLEEYCHSDSSLFPH